MGPGHKTVKETAHIAETDSTSLLAPEGPIAHDPAWQKQPTSQNEQQDCEVDRLPSLIPQKGIQ